MALQVHEAGDDKVRLLNCYLMGGQSFYLGVLHRLMCHEQLSHTIYAREVSRSCVGCFIVYTVLFRFTTDHYTTSVM